MTDLIGAKGRKGGGGRGLGGCRGGAIMALADRTNLRDRTPDTANGERENLW